MTASLQFGICYSPTWSTWSPPYSNTGPQAQFSDADFFNDSFQALWNSGYTTSHSYRRDLETIGSGDFSLLRLYDWGPTRGWNGTVGNAHLNFLAHAHTHKLQVIIPISNYFLSDDTYAWNKTSPDVHYSFQSAPSAIQNALKAFVGSVVDPNTKALHAAIHSFSVGNEIDINTLVGQGSSGPVSPGSRLARVIWWIVNLHTYIVTNNLGKALLTSPISNADQGNPGVSPPSYWFAAFVNGVTANVTQYPFGTAGGSGTFTQTLEGLSKVGHADWYYNSVNIYQTGSGLAATLGQYDRWQPNSRNNLNWPGQAFNVPLLLTEIGVQRTGSEGAQFDQVTKHIAETIRTYVKAWPASKLMGYCLYEYSDEPYLNANWGIFKCGAAQYNAPTGPTKVSYATWPSTPYPVDKLEPVMDTGKKNTLIAALAKIFSTP